VSDANAAPTFKACDTMRDSGWSVLVTWPNDRKQYLDGFQSFDETVAWVNDKSLAWLEAQQCPDSASAPLVQAVKIDVPASVTVPKAPGRDVAAIDQLINVLDTHRDSSKEDRKARGEEFKDELEPK
jgi:hypothetical protein